MEGNAARNILTLLSSFVSSCFERILKCPLGMWNILVRVPFNIYFHA
jgi:hypothetical protein